MTARNLKLDDRIEPLGSRHDRAAFSCGVAALDIYIQRQARQDMERNLAAVFVLTSDGKTIAGFYTYGEIARKKGVHGFHNQTLVVLSVG